MFSVSHLQPQSKRASAVSHVGVCKSLTVTNNTPQTQTMLQRQHEQVYQIHYQYYWHSLSNITGAKSVGKKISPDKGDRTMFPDLWTSSNLLKMTFNLKREREETIRQFHSPLACTLSPKRQKMDSVSPENSKIGQSKSVSQNTIVTVDWSLMDNATVQIWN